MSDSDLPEPGQFVFFLHVDEHVAAYTATTDAEVLKIVTQTVNDCALEESPDDILYHLNTLGCYCEGAVGMYWLCLQSMKDWTNRRKESAP